MEKLTGLLGNVLVASWDVLVESSLFILFGFFVAGILKGFIPDDFIQRHLGKKNKTSIFKASLFGIPIPLCSCGVIPAAAGLRQQGADRGAVCSFMISTPETGVDSIAITYALLDPFMTLFRPIAAFFTAMSTGMLVNLADGGKGRSKKFKPGTPLPMAMAGADTHSCGCTGHGHVAENLSGLAKSWNKLQLGMRFAFGELLTDIGPWLLFGIVLAGIITVFLSPTFVSSYMGDGILSMLIMIVLATPLYVCATASTPIAAALALKGLSPGAALVFLLAGPATNMATITVVARLLGRKTAVIYVSSIMCCSLVLGLIVNYLYLALGLSITHWISGAEQESHGILYVIATVILLACIGRPWFLRLYARIFRKKVVSLHHDHHHGDC